MGQDNTQTAILGGLEEGGTVDGDGNVTQERITDADGSKVTAKKETKTLSNANENKVDEKRKSERPCTAVINMSPSVYLRHMYNLIAGKHIW